MTTIPLFTAADVPDLGAEPDRDAWCTPPEIAGPLSTFARLCGDPDGWVDHDPCSNDRSIIQCRRRYTREDAPTADPIRPWRGTAYCNWPWSDPSPWLLAITEEIAAGHCPWIVGCGIADPSVSWFAHVWQADLVCWPDHRVMFDAPPGAKASSNSHPIIIPLWIAKYHPWPLADSIAFHFAQAFGHLGPITPRPLEKFR